MKELNELIGHERHTVPNFAGGYILSVYNRDQVSSGTVLGSVWATSGVQASAINQEVFHDVPFTNLT